MSLMKQHYGNNGLPITDPNYSCVPGNGRDRSPMRKMWYRMPSCVIGGISGNYPEILRLCLSLRSDGPPLISPDATAGAWPGRIGRTEGWRRPRPILHRSRAKETSAGWKSKPPCFVCRPSNAKFSCSRSGRNLHSNRLAKFSPCRPTPPPHVTATPSAHCASN